MTFFSISFLVFFLFLCILLGRLKNLRIQHVILLIANLLFYMIGDYRSIFLLLGIIVICYVCALFYEKSGRKLILYIGVFICVLVLFLFKYLDFFTLSFSNVFGIKSKVTLNIILPLGISFYIFQAMSYLFDIKNEIIKAEHNFLKLAVYISFFPVITAGPIMKARHFLPQLDKLHTIKKGNVYEGIQLFLTGLTKKFVFADRIGIAVDAVFSAPAAYNSISIVFTIIGYVMQIYFDFSGYSDMAIGIAKICDFDLKQNFNAPYLAQNPSDFWRRWHISLSSWFKEYVYIPLGGNRKGKLRTYINLFITMVLSGIWHGANLTFLVWGVIHGIGCVGNKLFRDLFNIKESTKRLVVKITSIMLNCIFVSLAWVFFRADSFTDAITFFKQMGNRIGVFYINVYVVCSAVLFGLVNIYSLCKNNGNAIQIKMDLDKMWCKVIFSAWIFAVLMLMYVGNQNFIYAQF